MKNMSRAALAGGRAFGFWLGHGDIFERPQALLEALDTRDQCDLARLAELLYASVSENDRRTAIAPFKTPADEIMWALSERIGLIPKPFWPGHAPYALCLTHDVDRTTYRWHAVAKSVRGGNICKGLRLAICGHPRTDDPFFNFRRIEDREREWGIRSALFILFERPRWIRAISKLEPQHVIGVYRPEDIMAELRRLDGLGFEIALHGSLDAHEDSRAVEDEMSRLRNILGDPERRFGVRNHYLQFLPDKTPNILQKCRALYDATIGYNFICGFPRGTVFPMVLFPTRGGVLPELPLAVMDTTLKHAAPGLEGVVADALVDEVRRRGGLAMINWHQRFCNPDTGGFMVKWVERAVSRAKDDGACILPPRDLARFWMERLDWEV